MSAILPCLQLDSNPVLKKHFAYHQICWIEAEDHLHAQGRQVCALAEKSIRIGWTYCDGFKNVRKRLRFKKRDYLFVTKDYPSAIEYMVQAREFANIFNLTHAIVSHGEEWLKIPRAGARARKRGFTDEIKIGVIKFDNGSRIIAFSSNPQAMAVYGGDVGLDEFARHPNAQLLWETAQGRVALANDLAVWSAHDGEDTLFYQFAQQARALSTLSQPLSQPLSPQSSSQSAPALRSASPPSIGLAKEGDEGGSALGSNGKDAFHRVPDSHSQSGSDGQSGSDQSQIKIQNSKIDSPLPSPLSLLPSSPWNLYFRVTMPDAIELGFLDHINEARGTKLEPAQFLTDCRARAGLPEIYEQSYLCNPVTPAASIVDWSTIERCRHDYQIERLHLDHDQIQTEFGSPAPHHQIAREQKIAAFLHANFPALFSSSSSSSSSSSKSPSSPATRHPSLRLGFDIAASGTGDLAAIYIDAIGNFHSTTPSLHYSDAPPLQHSTSEASLVALLTTRTDDWHFLKSALFTFLHDLPNLQGAGDESGLGKQICWEAANQFGQTKFTPINFRSKKSDLGFLLMNHLSSAQKRFPKDHPDIAADFFALRKTYTGTNWLFAEGKNPYNTASHCDIAWAGALASHAHTLKRSNAWAMVG